MKEQEFPIIGGLMATMILIFQVDLLILTDLPGLLIHLVCLRFEDHRGIQQLIWSPQLLSLLRNLRGYPDEKADKVYISPWPKHQNLGVWQSDLIKSVCLAANDGDRAAWTAADRDFSLLMQSFLLHYRTLFHKLVM